MMYAQLYIYSWNYWINTFTLQLPVTSLDRPSVGYRKTRNLP